jgi:hypothetical protein
MFVSLTRLFARRPSPPAASRKTVLGLHALETRECPAVLTADLHVPLPAAEHSAPAAPVLMEMVYRPLNPQPLPP